MPLEGEYAPSTSDWAREQAEKIVQQASSDTVAQIENRFCYHKDCPAERCNHPGTRK